MNTVIIYVSTHHGNTKKIVEKMAESISADLIDITKNTNPDISMYDIVGVASGIYFHSMHKAIQKFIQNAPIEEHQEVFFVDTCGIPYIDYTRNVKKILKERNIHCLGSFQCRGYDTYGIWGKLGGIAKKHPNEQDMIKAEKFIKRVIQGKVGNKSE